jgi:SpoIID/LytB domain protein
MPPRSFDSPLPPAGPARPARPRPLLRRGGTWLLGTLLLLPVGCRASDRPALPPVPPAVPLQAAALHWPVPAPPALRGSDPVLWVALASRLGAGPAQAAASLPPLRLTAAAGALALEDGAGVQLRAPGFVLHWRWQPLPEPLLLRREVLGPFASYESAEAAARRWQELGVPALIARPADWEVWAPAGTAPPPQLEARLVERRETGRFVPVLLQSGSERVLAGPIRLQAPQGLRWGEGVHRGSFRLQADAHGGWSLVEEVPLERYLLGVVPHEIGAGSPPAALAAQAVLARTWAVRNRIRYRVDGYHLCADTQCQVYSDPRQAGAAVRAAISASRSLVMTAAGEPIHAVYHASNGGVAAGLEEAWEAAPLPYLIAFADGDAAFAARTPVPLAAAGLAGLLRDGAGAYGADHPRFRWRRQLSAARLAEALEARGQGVGAVRGLAALERGPSGRVLALQIEGATGRTVLRRDAIRRTLRELPSTLFTLSPAGPGLWSLVGGGFGHGAGLSQAGAIDLARRGWSSERILRHYYPGATLQPLEAIAPALEGS